MRTHEQHCKASWDMLSVLPIGLFLSHELQHWVTDEASNPSTMHKKHQKGCFEIKRDIFLWWLLLWLNVINERIILYLNVQENTILPSVYLSSAVTDLFESWCEQIKVIFLAEGSSLLRRGGIDLGVTALVFVLTDSCLPRIHSVYLEVLQRDGHSSHSPGFENRQMIWRVCKRETERTFQEINT